MPDVECVASDLCGAGEYSPVLVGRDYRFGGSDVCAFVRCHDGGLAHLNPRPTWAALARPSERHYTSAQVPATPEDVRTARWQGLRRAWHGVSGNYSDRLIAKEKGRVLDLGCGDGKFMAPLRNKGCEVYGIEPNRRLSELHARLGLNVVSGTLGEGHFPSEFLDADGLRTVLARMAQSLPYMFSGYTLRRLASEAELIVKSAAGSTTNDFFSTSLKSYVHDGGMANGSVPLDRVVDFA